MPITESSGPTKRRRDKLRVKFKVFCGSRVVCWILECDDLPLYNNFDWIQVWLDTSLCKYSTYSLADSARNNFSNVTGQRPQISQSLQLFNPRSLEEGGGGCQTVSCL